MNAKSTAAFVVLAFSALCSRRESHVGGSKLEAPRLEGNGYADIIVRLPRGLKPRDSGEFFGQLERLLRSASGKLLRASDGLWYLKSVRVLVPPEMETPRNLLLQEATWELFHDAHIVLTKEGHKCKARQSRGCGELGDFVALPISALESSADLETAASSVVRSWAQFRYGVFEETAFGSEPQWCFYDGSFWRPTGCYTTDVTARPEMTEDGALECSKRDVNTRQIFQSASEPASSLMFTSTVQKVQKFCDARGNHSHLHLAPTKHNLLCNSRSVWEVIRNSPDYSQSVSRLNVQPATLFDYVKPRTHRFFYVVQACAPDPANQTYSKIMAAVNEGLRRFLFAAPRSARWSVVLLDGGNVTAPTNAEFDTNNTTWQARREYLRELDRSIKYSCTDANVESTFKDILQVAQNEATTVLALVHSDAVSTRAIQALAAVDTLRLALILFDTATPQGTAWRSAALTGSQLFMVPTTATQETMAALVDLALHTVHHSTAALDGDVVKVFQRTDVILNDGVSGSFSFRPFDADVLSFIVACPDVYSIEESDVTFNGSAVPSYRVKMSMFATEQLLTEAPGVMSVTYAVKARKSSQRCSFMASIRSTAQEPRVRLRGWFRRKKLELPPGLPQVLYAELLYGEQVVKGALVEAVVYHVAHGNATPTVVQLRDNGLLEPDMTKGDGVYSGYFLSSSRIGGWYSVLVRATGSLAGAPSSDGGPVTSFCREEFVGSFWAPSPGGLGPRPANTMFPPGVVRDLRARRVEPPNVTLEWSAPGSEYDSGDGAGSIYELRYSRDQRRLSDDFANQPGLHLDQKGKPGDRESATIQLPDRQSGTTLAYYFALRSKNKAHRQSDISNIAVVVLEDHTNPVDPTSNKTSDNSSIDVHVTGKQITSTPWINSTAETLLEPTLDASNSSFVVLYFNRFTETQFYYLAGGVAGAFVLFVLLCNCIICLACVQKRRSADSRRKTHGAVMENSVSLDKPLNAYDEQPQFDTAENVGALRKKLSNLQQRPGGANNAKPAEPQIRPEHSPKVAEKTPALTSKGSSSREAAVPFESPDQRAPSHGSPSVTHRSTAKEKPRSRVPESRMNNISNNVPAVILSEPPLLLQRMPSGSVRSSKRSNASSSRTTRLSDKSRRAEKSATQCHVDHARKRSGDYYDLGVV